MAWKLNLKKIKLVNYTDVFSSKYQITANIMNILLHARPPEENVTCLI